VALAAALVAVLASGATLLLASGAQGDASRTRGEQLRISDAATARAALTKASTSVPAAVDGTCVRTANVYGQGQSCRLPDGMYVVPQAEGPALVTHGPDIVDSTPRAARDGGFGTVGSIACSPPSRTRHIVLLYLLPKDFDSGAEIVHGDRFATVADELRQALYDASEVVDRRAQQLAPGQRRRLRVLCDDDGRPTVQRVVLLHTAQEYLSAQSGFKLIADDLQQLGLAPAYDTFSEQHLPSVRRLLAYYDGEFSAGLSGQGTLYPRSSMLGQGIRTTDPLVSRTSRNISNNPPEATLAVQYGSGSFVGATLVPDPPLFTSLLHELSHTLGAVQDEPPTASKVGHCLDGLDVMCYADGGDGGTYSDAVCPDPVPPYSQDDEVYDCNGDTYFHPAPPTGNWLADPVAWNLAAAANETMTSSTSGRPAAVTGLASSGTGTRRTLRWTAVPGAAGYDVAARTGSGAWEYLFTSTASATPVLRPSSSYELRVSAVASGLVVGPSVGTTLRTGLDTTPPAAPSGISIFFALGTSAALNVRIPADNVRATKLRIERRDGTRWVTHATVALPRGATAGKRIIQTIGSLATGRTTTLRLRALDGRGNLGPPSPAVRVTPRR
jgi:hypothetical protein